MFVEIYNHVTIYNVLLELTSRVVASAQCLSIVYRKDQTVAEWASLRRKTHCSLVKAVATEKLKFTKYTHL